MPDALQLLRDDHREVKELFRQFEEAENSKQKQQIAEKAIMSLEIHADIEEEIFYPAVRKQDDVESELMDEAEEEHHVARLLIDELKRARKRDDKWEAKFKVLAESVKHHIEEEESEMLPRAAEAGGAKLAALGEQMEQRKMQLQRSMSRNGTARRSTGRTTRTASSRGRTATTRVAGRRSSRTTASRSRTAGSRAGGSTSRSSTSKARSSTSKGTSSRGHATRGRKASARSSTSRISGRRTSSRASSSPRARSSSGRRTGASRTRSSSSRSRASSR